MCYHMVTSGVAVATTKAWLGAIYAATAGALSTPRPACALNGSVVMQCCRWLKAAPLLGRRADYGAWKMMRNDAFCSLPDERWGALDREVKRNMSD